MVSQCSLMPGCQLACGDQRRLTGNGSALEVVLHDYALYKSTFTLLYFTFSFYAAVNESQQTRICMYTVVVFFKISGRGRF